MIRSVFSRDDSGNTVKNAFTVIKTKVEKPVRRLVQLLRI